MIVPRGDVHVQVGDDAFTMFCMLNPEHQFYDQEDFNAEDLVFYVARDKGLEELPSWYVNDTTIATSYDPSEERTEIVTCSIKRGDYRAGICGKNVYVGTPPEPPTNFKCISENWQSLNCTWEEPENPIKTSYALSYLAFNRFGGW